MVERRDLKVTSVGGHSSEPRGGWLLRRVAEVSKVQKQLGTMPASELRSCMKVEVDVLGFRP